MPGHSDFCVNLGEFLLWLKIQNVATQNGLWPLSLFKHVFANMQGASAEVTCWLTFRHQGLI